jgi:hypothetical protein
VQQNRFAYVGLWLVLASWLLLIFRFLAGELGAVDDLFDWLYFAVIAAAMIAATAGVAAIRKHGEGFLAVAVLAFSFLLPALYILFFLFINLTFPDDGALVD